MVAEQTVIDDRYELESMPIGEGGMGEVYRAHDRRLDRKVAVKLIRFPFGQHDETLVKRFLHESRIMARLEHPGAPAIHDVGVFDDPRVGSRPFMVMQFVEGISLDYIIDEHEDIPVSWVASAAAQVAAVLAAAHKRGIFHRDLKPSNLMLCHDGTIKVLDFGLAMFHDPDVSRLTRTGTLLGTPSYMSPEQVQGATLGPQSDLYTLGLVMHELLTGQRLFDGRTEYEVFHRQVNEPAPSVRTTRPEVPEEIDRLVLRLLEKHPADRPADAVEVCRALLPFTQGAGFLPGTVAEGSNPIHLYSAVVGSMTDTVGPTIPRKTRGGPVDLDQVRQVAVAFAHEARYNQAATLLEAVLSAVVPALAPDDPQVLTLRGELAEVLFKDSDYRKAAPYSPNSTRFSRTTAVPTTNRCCTTGTEKPLAMPSWTDHRSVAPAPCTARRPAGQLRPLRPAHPESAPPDRTHGAGPGTPGPAYLRSYSTTWSSTTVRTTPTQ